MDEVDRGLTDTDLQVPETTLVRFAQGDRLFLQGSAGREMYILRSGRVRVSITKGGRSIPITELGKGSHVGEMSFIAGIPRTATVTALEPVIASRISPDVIVDDRFSISGWAISIARVLVERIKRTTELLGDYMASGPHPMETESGAHLDVDGSEFAIELSDSGEIITLKGVFEKGGIDLVKDAVRKAMLQHPEGIVIEFSEVIDIDGEALAYLLQLAKGPHAKDDKIRLRNLQLIRNKVAGMKEIRNMIESIHVPLRRVEAGTYLIRQGERERSMFVIRSGEFDIIEERRDQDPILLARSRAGDVVGEMSLLKEGERSASVRASKSSTVLEIAPKEFFSNIYAVPDWFMSVVDGLVKRLRNTNEMLSQISSLKEAHAGVPEMELPLQIVVDDTVPGKFVLSGTMTLGNLQYLAPIIRHVMYSGQKNITLDINKVRRMDGETIRYLLNLYMVLRESGGQLKLIGTQDQILWLKEHNGQNPLPGFEDDSPM